jgi:hypothetical protein
MSLLLLSYVFWEFSCIVSELVRFGYEASRVSLPALPFQQKCSERGIDAVGAVAYSNDNSRTISA